MGKGINITTIVIMSIVLIIVAVGIVNVGMSIFYPRPDYQDYCGEINKLSQEKIQMDCEAEGGEWQSYDRDVIDPDGVSVDGWCDKDFTCRAGYDEASQDYNQNRFYIFGVLGVVLMLIGLFVPVIVVNIVGLVTGGILITEGIVFNFSNKIAVFIALIFIFAILITFTIMKLMKKE